MKKYVSLLMLVCITMLSVVGCSSPKLTPEESVLALYNLYILEDSSGVIELGMTEDEVTTVLDAYDQALSDSLRSNITSAGLPMEDTAIEEIVAARKEALKAMTATCELVSSDDETAVVTLKTTYFDEIALDQEAANKAIEVIQETDSTDEEELLAIAAEAYAQYLVEGYKAVTPSEEVKEITVNCVLSDNIWLPADVSGFGEELGSVISGQ